MNKKDKKARAALRNQQRCQNNSSVSALTKEEQEKKEYEEYINFLEDVASRKLNEIALWKGTLNSSKNFVINYRSEEIEAKLLSFDENKDSYEINIKFRKRFSSDPGIKITRIRRKYFQSEYESHEEAQDRRRWRDEL